PINISGASARMVITNIDISGGAWSGSGNVTIASSNAAAAQLTVNASMAAFSGTLSMGVNSNIPQFNNATNANANAGSASATFDLGSGGSTLRNLNGAGLTYNLGA